MNEYAELKDELSENGFMIQQETEDEDIRVDVPFLRVREFANNIQRHLNAPYNYVDVQFAEEKTTVLVFRDKIFFLHNQEEADAARRWAISAGLPEKQADWKISFE